MDISQFIAITVVGGFLTAVIDIIKSQWGTSSNQTKLVTLALSVVVGTVYVWLQSTPYFQTVVLILGAASTVYALKK